MTRKGHQHSRGKWKSVPCKAVLLFVGIFLGDGYVCERNAQKKKQDFIGVVVKKERKIYSIWQVLLDLGVKYTETPGKEGYTCFYVYDFALREYCRLLGKVKQKFSFRVIFWIIGISGYRCF